MKLLLAVAILCFGSVTFAQTGVYSDARALVGRAQADLKQASDFSHKSGKEQERYDNAQKHLSEFDRELDKGKFDKGKLDAAIDDVKNVVENNTLSPDLRDTLQADLDRLRELREHPGK